MYEELIYVVIGVLASLLAILTVTFKGNIKEFKKAVIAFVSNLKIYTIYNRIPKDLRALIKEFVIRFILKAEEIYLGYKKDENGSRRHFYVKETVMGIVDSYGLNKHIKEEHIDQLIKEYVKKLKLAKGENPHK